MSTARGLSGLDIGARSDTEIAKALPDDRRRQVLALGGGGFRGLYSALFLKHSEEHFKCKIRDRFALLTGTSIGALIAAGLAMGVSAADLAAKFLVHGPRIFKRRFLWTQIKRTFGAPYSAKALRAAVVATIGEKSAALELSQVKAPLAICAVNYTHGGPQTFLSQGIAGNDASRTTVLEAVLASAAAPTYFPPRRVGADTLIDGGLVANAPELVGLTEAYKHLKCSLDSLYVLAIGTAGRRQGAALTSIDRPGTLSWMLRRRLFQTTLAAQEVLAATQCQALLGARYYRVDNEPAENQVAAIKDFDLTSQEAIDTLASLAGQSWSAHRDVNAFRNFFVA